MFIDFLGLLRYMGICNTTKKIFYGKHLFIFRIKLFVNTEHVGVSQDLINKVFGNEHKKYSHKQMSNRNWEKGSPIKMIFVRCHLCEIKL